VSGRRRLDEARRVVESERGGGSRRRRGRRFAADGAGRLRDVADGTIQCTTSACYATDDDINIVVVVVVVVVEISDPTNNSYIGCNKTQRLLKDIRMFKVKIAKQKTKDFPQSTKFKQFKVHDAHQFVIRQLAAVVVVVVDVSAAACDDSDTAAKR